MKKYLPFIMLLAFMLSMFSVISAATVQVGDGTATTHDLPIAGNFEYGYTQQIYTQTQINYPGEITKIRFYYVSGLIANSKDWKIFMGHTSKTEFTSTTDWEPLGNLTQVFNGDVTAMLPAANNWMEITLQTPFNFNNTDNLLIAVYQYTRGYNIMSWGAFTSGTNTGMSFVSYRVNPDPAAPPAASERFASINRIQLVIIDTEAPMAPTLVSPAHNAEVYNGQALSWVLPSGSADATGYDVYIDDTIVSNNQPGTSYPILPMAEGNHTWYVVAHNNIGSSPPSDTRTFEYVKVVIIGTEKYRQRCPFNAWFGYGRSLGLYTSAEIRLLGNITTVGWSVATATTEYIPYKIYAKITDDTALTAMTWDAFISTATVVKQGGYTFDSTGWHNFLLDTPITYTGGNLLIGVEANQGSHGMIGQDPYFHYTASATDSHQYWQEDYNPPTGTGNLDTCRPNLLLKLFPFSPPQVLQAIDPMFFNMNETFQEIDLSDYFSESFDFSYSNNQNITLELSSDSLLRVQPIPDWHGTEYITIRATNPLGYVEQTLKVTVYQSWKTEEHFDHAGVLPANWTTSHAGTTDFPWQSVQIEGDDYAMKTMANTGRTANERLFSPSYNLSNYKDIVVSFDTDFLPYAAGSGTFAYTLNNVTYTVVETFSTATNGIKTYTIANLDAKPSVKFRWSYANASANTGQENHWIVDNFSIFGIVRDTQAPSAINGFTLSSQSSSTATLSWQASSDLYFGRYELYISTDEQVTIADQLWSTEQDPALYNVGTTQTTITGLASGDYWIAIRALDQSNNPSALTAPVFVHIDGTAPQFSDPIPALQPEPLWSNARSVEIGCTISDLNLIDPNSLYYRIDANGNGIYDDDEAWTVVPQTGRQIRNRDVLTILFEVSYEADGVFAFEFKAADFSGNIGYSGLSSQEGISDDWVLRIDTLPPAEITNFFAEEITDTSVKLSWTASSDLNFLGYRIHFSTSSEVSSSDPYWDWDNDANLSLAGEGLVSTVLSDLDLATRYYFLLLATDEVGWTTQYPHVITAMTTSSAEPKAPENLSISIVDGLLMLDWDEVIQDVLGNPIIPSFYEVFVGDHPDFICDFDSLIATVNEPHLELEDVVDYADRLFFKVIAHVGMIRSNK